MSTLHQYKWLDLDHCQHRLHYMVAGDALLIYGQFTPQDQQMLKSAMSAAGLDPKCCFWLDTTATSNSDIVNINYQQWLTLISQHDKTHTWK